MNGTRYHAAGGAQFGASAGDLVQSLGAMGSLLRDMLTAATTGLPQPSLRNARSCSFPSYDCCNPDLGSLVRQAQQGETVRMPVRLSNTTGKRRSFALTVTGPLKDSRGRTAKPPSVTPTSLDLDDGEVGQVMVEAKVDDEFAAGASYSTRVLVKAEDCEPQHLTVTIAVATDEGPLIRLCCPCDPRLRPLRWYHHYYCDPPRGRQPTPDQPTPGRQPTG